jgi:hypothetical protein
MVLAEKARNSCAQGRAKISHHSGGEFVYEEILAASSRAFHS